jgi:hypothetical protein
VQSKLKICVTSHGSQGNEWYDFAQPRFIRRDLFQSALASLAYREKEIYIFFVNQVIYIYIYMIHHAVIGIQTSSYEDGAAILALAVLSR